MNDRQFEDNIGRICRNDREGLKNIYEDYCPLIYSVVLELVQNREDAEDVASGCGISHPVTVPETGTGHGF